ncbi:Cys1 [Hyposoter didymator ichnovirus]|nr:Cys1 [Hyposoter didymator ichnovirus]
MSWTKIMWVVLASFCGLLLICVIVSNVMKQFEPKEKCSGNYRPCGRVVMPCCRQRQLKNPCDIPEDFICNHLSGGYCEPLSRIGNLHEYIKLTTNLNITNLKERISQYQRIRQYSTSERIVYYVIYCCYGSLFLLVALVNVYYFRWARNYTPVETDDIPEWN